MANPEKRKNIFERIWNNMYKPGSSEEKDCPSQSEKIDVAAYEKELRANGVAGVKAKLSKDMANWTNVELHTAVTGNSGTGKSSFINSIRGLKAKAPGAAKVGVNETTMECQSYKHPDNKSFIVWDLPGVGTPNFPQNGYLEKVKYRKYDFFIIMSRNRFTENDLWLALEVQKQNKTFFFVRANIDADISNDKEDDPDGHNEQELLNTMRDTIKQKLKTNGIIDPKVFLINNRARDRYDYGKLNDELLSSCDGLKKDSMALSLAAVTKTVMAEKKRVLEGRINGIALDVACSSGEYEQIGRFKDEIKFYQKQFDIDDVTLAENKDFLSLSKESMRQYQVLFDEWSSGNEMHVKTPTARRQEQGIWDRFADCFSWSKEDTLLYNFCQESLKNNLDTMYSQAYTLYDIKATTQMVHAAAKILHNRDKSEIGEELDFPPRSKIYTTAYEKQMHDNGVPRVQEIFWKCMINLTNIEIHTAVTGSSGTGKSSFINSIRGLKAKDEGAARVGVTETTMECKSYRHPENKFFIVWDLPGVGTPNFPRNGYLEKVKYQRYDFFIIMSRSRFTETDLWLALEVQKQNKKFFFVRSNIDVDVANDKEDNPDDHNEQELLDTMKNKTEDELKANGITDPKVFLISNRVRDKYDYRSLNNELLSSWDFPPRSKIYTTAYEKQMHDNGVPRVQEIFWKCMINLTNIEIHTAVTGSSGTGKSSFINSIRGLKAKDEGPARVGVTETTMECKSYRHPENKFFIVWDLPGVGTPNFPRNGYLEKVKYQRYDFFIIMSRRRFTDTDLWLALEVQKQNKKFFFVRSNIDVDVANDKEDNPDDHNEQELLDTMKNKTEDALKANGITDPKVFLISNRVRDKYDYRSLNNELLSSFEERLAAVTKTVMV